MLTSRPRAAQATTVRYGKIIDRRITDRQHVDREAARIFTADIITGRQIAAQEATNTGDAINRPISQSMDDIERGYGDDRTAIMQDFARRLAGAKTPGERRAIKDQRKSALAAARGKAKRLKEARRAAASAARQRKPDHPRNRPR